MIFVATVHYRTSAWIDIQQRYLRRFLPADHVVYASLEGIDTRHDAAFTRVVRSRNSHAAKLNNLAAVISRDADADDVIVFLDGDAFPVADVRPVIERGLDEGVLVAVRRDENGGDPQPHPCFCAVRVGTWHDLHGDWGDAHAWRTAAGSTRADVGSNLLYLLEARGLPWVPLLRTNEVNPHPLWYGIYGGVVYHHGAGFRFDSRLSNAEAERDGLRQPGGAWAANRATRKAWQVRRDRRAARLHRANVAEGEQVFERIRRDPSFYRAFQPSLSPFGTAPV